MCIRDRLKDGRAPVRGLYSEKTGKTYDCLLYTSIRKADKAAAKADKAQAKIPKKQVRQKTVCLLYTSATSSRWP